MALFAYGYLAIMLLTLVHELGHYFAARTAGVHIECFALGFGRPLLRYRTRKGTTFALNLIPAGGYVKMLHENHAAVAPAEKPHCFNTQTIYVRALILAAGPSASFLGGLAIFFLLFFSGTLRVLTPQIETVTAHSLAAKAEIPANTRIVAVDGIDTPDWPTINMALLLSLGTARPITLHLITAQDASLTRTLPALPAQYDFKAQSGLLDYYGITPFFPALPIIVATVMPESPAADAALRPGDRVLAINDQPLQNWSDFLAYIEPRPKQQIILSLQRGAVIQRITLRTQAIKQSDGTVKGFVGIAPLPQPLPVAALTRLYYPFLPAVGAAWTRATLIAYFHYAMLGKLLSGKLSLHYLGGPIQLFLGADRAVKNGWPVFFYFLGVLSVAVAVFNALPIPGLDGGQLFYLLLEKITGKPISYPLQVLLLRFAAILLLLLLVQVLLNDIEGIL